MPDVKKRTGRIGTAVQGSPGGKMRTIGPDRGTLAKTKPVPFGKSGNPVRVMRTTLKKASSENRRLFEDSSYGPPGSGTVKRRPAGVRPTGGKATMTNSEIDRAYKASSGMKPKPAKRARGGGVRKAVRGL